jgi:hypothetical protein
MLNFPEKIKKPLAATLAMFSMNQSVAMSHVSAAQLEKKAFTLEQNYQNQGLSEAAKETIVQVDTLLKQHLTTQERKVLENFKQQTSTLNSVTLNKNKKLSSSELKALKNQVVLLEAMIAQTELKALNSSFSDWIQIKYESLTVKLKFYYKLAKTNISSSQISQKIRSYIQSIISKLTK